MKIFGREPAAWLGALQAILAVSVGFGLPALPDGLADAVLVLLAAASTAWVALRVRPIEPAVFAGVVTALVPVLDLLGATHLSQGQVAGLQTAVAAGLTLLVRTQVTPADAPRVGAGVLPTEVPRPGTETV